MPLVGEVPALAVTVAVIDGGGYRGLGFEFDVTAVEVVTDKYPATVVTVTALLVAGPKLVSPE